MSRQDVTRRIEPGILEIDLQKSTLIINYNIHAEVVDEDGKVLQSKSEDKQKIVPLEVYDDTDVEELAEEIVETQKYVPPQKIDRVIKLLTQLQQYIVKKAKRSKHGKSSKKDKKHSSKKSSRSSSSKHRKEKSNGSGGGDKQAKEGETDDPEKPKELDCSVEELDQYLEHLYNDDDKVKSLGVRKVLTLAKKDPTTLEIITENEPLIGALARVLQDDYRVIDVALPLCTLFCIFSKFSQMHELLRSKGIGSIVVKIIETENSRYDLRSKKMSEYRKAVEDGRKDQEFLDTEEQRTKAWLVKQEGLLNSCVRLLLNMSEDVDVERKMAQKTDLMKFLVLLMNRRNPELLKVVLVFLKKLCIVMENSIKLCKYGIVKNALALTSSRDPYVAYQGLKLLYNLSFSPLVRKTVGELDGVNQVLQRLRSANTRMLAVKVLYNLSTDSHCQQAFANSPALTNVLQLCMMSKQPELPAPLGGLVVNLLLEPENCKKVCNTKAHEQVMTKFMKTRDIYLAKCVKVLSLYTYRVQEALGDEDEYAEIEIWGSWIKELISLAMEIHQERGSPELLVEVLATLSNMSPDDLPEDTMWKDLLTVGRCQVLEFVEELCDSRIPSARPDIVMQAICCVGAFALEPDVCAFLAEHRPRIFRLLQLDLYFFTEDTGITLQILFVLYRLLRFQEVCVEVLSSNSNSFSGADIQKFVSAVGEFVQHPHPEIQRVAHSILDLIMEFDSVQGTGQLFALAREVKFAVQNQDWIEIMEEREQNKRFVIEERGTVVNDGEEDMTGSSEGGSEDMDSGEYAEYMDHGGRVSSLEGSDGLYQDEGKHGGRGK